MGFLHNETYLVPKRVGAVIDNRRWAVLVRDLVRRELVSGPFVVVTGRALDLPFSRHGRLADTLLDGKSAARGTRVRYRGDDLRTLDAAMARPDGEDLVIAFAAIGSPDPLVDERPTPLLLFALDEPRTFELHLQRFDEDGAELPVSPWTSHTARHLAVVLGTDVDAGRRKPIAALATALRPLLGAVAQKLHIVH
jgi:hypothetical protein